MLFGGCLTSFEAYQRRREDFCLFARAKLGVLDLHRPSMDFSLRRAAALPEAALADFSRTSRTPAHERR